MASKQLQPRSLVFLFIIFLHIAISYSASDDEENLLQFKKGLTDQHDSLSTWSPDPDPGTAMPPCFENKNNWDGLICSTAGHIWGIRLENMNISGSIDVEALSRLSKLRSLSLINNGFSGPLPDFRKLRALKALFLSNNQFERTIAPDAFDGMRRLRKVYLSNNKFSGEIPVSLVNLEKLVELKLDGNQFQGGIPDFMSSPNLRVFNVSNNQLQGPVPLSLARFDTSVFAGNKKLCGPPLGKCTEAEQVDTPPKPKPKPKPSNQSIKPIPIVAIVVGVALAIILAVSLLLVILRGRRDKNYHTSPSSTEEPSSVEDGSTHSAEGMGGGVGGVGVGGGGGGKKGGDTGVKLTFVREDRLKFDLPDLLKASAEILGSGCFGSSYKATFNNGDSVVVKRFKKMNHVGREEFQEHMRRLGRLSHPNLLMLVAYYYRKEEKLFITEPIERGSLAVLLHGQTRGKPTLDWPTRLKVIKGVAKGLSCLYKELACLVAPHGHLKSSNVLINHKYEPILSDYALIPLINQENVQEMMVAYKSPEFFNDGRITKKTDVWSLGILILEVLTGKFPASFLQQGTDVDITIWVDSVINEGFDKNMNNTCNSEGEMQKLLNIGISCCESNVDKRLDIKEACERIEDIQECDNDDDFYSISASEVDARSSRGLSDDFSVIIN